MGIVKLSKSGKQVQFICDEGVVYVTSTKYLIDLLNKGDAQKVCVLGRLPLLVSKDRFPQSVVWNPDGYDQNLVDTNKISKDALSATVRGSLEKVEGFKDKEVW